MWIALRPINFYSKVRHFRMFDLMQKFLMATTKRSIKISEQPAQPLITGADSKTQLILTIIRKD